jgi:hypothetical protein
MQFYAMVMILIGAQTFHVPFAVACSLRAASRITAPVSVDTPANTVGFHHVNVSVPRSALWVGCQRGRDGHRQTHPSIGVPVSAASEMTAHARPIRRPTSPTCELCGRVSRAVPRNGGRRT